MEIKGKSIILIIPYFGKWPVWFNAYLKSIEANQTINWLIPTDCNIPEKYPKNIEFIKMSFHEINAMFNEKLGFDVALNYRKFCDLKPTYGHVFGEEIKDYDFWGFCDMDIIWGNVRKYMTSSVLNNYDIISSRKSAISGHFNLFRNNKKLKFLYLQVPKYKELLSTNVLTRFDENLLTEVVKKNDTKRVFWDEILCNHERGRDSHQEYYINKRIWNNGGVYQVDENNTLDEVMYLHFINWKRTMTHCDLIESDTNSFYISFNKIHLVEQPAWTEYLNGVKNIFNGYLIKERRRYRKLKLKSLKKRIINKILNKVNARVK